MIFFYFFCLKLTIFPKFLCRVSDFEVVDQSVRWEMMSVGRSKSFYLSAGVVLARLTQFGIFTTRPEERTSFPDQAVASG